MGPNQIVGLIYFALGALLTMMAAGVVRVSKNPEANAAWRRQYKWLILLGGLLLLVRGGTYAAGLWCW